MQYYVKIFNKNTNELVGYYKETGKNCISKLPNGIKYWDTAKEALEVAETLDNGFVRDKDRHYYTAFVVVCGDSTKDCHKERVKTKQEKEEELKDALNTFIRKNSSRDGY